VKPNIKIYDEKDQILSTESITNDKPIICILEIQGLKFTSRNFQLEIELKQSMVVSPDPFLDECFIKRPIKKQQTQQEQKQEEVEEVEEEQVKQDITFDLDNLINQSAQHLAKNKDKIQFENNYKNNENNENNISPIDLEETFDKPKPLEKDIENKNENKHKNLFDLEEADIDFTNLQNVNELTPEEDIIEEVEDPNILKEVDLSSTLDNSLETLQLKKPNQVFYEIYQKAREKAKEAKKNAILAYLEMKNIKKTYMLDDIDESDNEFDEFASRDSSSDISDTESLEEE
jgi:glutamate synthase domain-containing protein 2